MFCSSWRGVMRMTRLVVALVFGVASVVAFERGAGVVVGVAVDFEDDFFVAPEEVGGVVGDANVDSGIGRPALRSEASISSSAPDRVRVSGRSGSVSALRWAMPGLWGRRSGPR
jgi:hypothetical protein